MKLTLTSNFQKIEESHSDQEEVQNKYALEKDILPNLSCFSKASDEFRHETTKN